MKKVYVAATSQHVGKTTSTLGLTTSFMKRGIDVGYCKPVGQHFVELGDLCVDKDALLFSKVMNFHLSAALHSPVILGPGATAAYIDNPEGFDYKKRIIEAARQLEAKHKMVVYEGTGHPGVGSVVHLSNADVAHILGAPVIMVVEGGIGSTIDELNMCTSLFREREVPIVGVIINKVLPEKLEKVKHYVGKHLKNDGVPLLGALPYDKALSNPIMETITHAVKGRVVTFIDNLDNRVEDIIPGSLLDDQEFEVGSNLLLVVSHKRFSQSIEQIKELSDRIGIEKSPLSGVIITGDGRHEKNFHESEISSNYIHKHQIPVITTPLDTLGSMIKINRIEVKINSRTPWKYRRATDLIQKYVNLDLINDKLIG